ncbi:alpha/beta hydrolase [Ketobacter sp. MCCC 1A13808]|uniref:alpha/beta hydrolase n=1 Tax=Ketobacter sp. MCCC 1A13808 TaxID=2602738 RepID=UPI0012EB3CA8|nr:alpha/beta hydrolase [Ketobacter sp. MCCC 1A13808]MVF13441.1 alpha/beta hydrolase [Ketobacter sp. MCCC 1A13808]
MNLKRVHPQLRKTYKRIPTLPFHNTAVLGLAKFCSRFLQPRAKSKYGVLLSRHRLSNSNIRVYRPEGECSGAGLLWIHGGGYIFGAAGFNDKECARYARELKLVVVSVDYRLASEFPFPCALDDCYEAWQWFLEQCTQLGVSPHRIVVSGQSAGGGLAAGLVQRIADQSGIQPAGQALFCPMLDDRTASLKELDKVQHLGWNSKSNRRGWSDYLGLAPGSPTVPPYASPARRENLSGLPPAWIGVGDIDLFYQEDCDYAGSLTKAGVACDLKIVPGAPHGFETVAPDVPITREFYDSHDQFLRKALQLTQPSKERELSA